MVQIWKKLLPHAVVVGLFMVIALAFFYPVLQGKMLLQGDIALYVGMAKERDDFRLEQNEESYWTNSAFAGMPTYQLGAKYPHNYIKELDSFIRFLPRPADYIFLYFIGFYIFFLCLKNDYRYAFLGSLAFGFSTYLIIILIAGHNAKAHAVGYFGWILGGIILCYRGKFLLGGLLALLGGALEVSANHFQMLYYLLFLITIIVVFESIKLFKQKKKSTFWKATVTLVFAAILALGLNATNLMATSEYAKYSTRGKSELSLTPEGFPKSNNNGMSYDYITEYSYGIFESLNLIVPRLTGGANTERLTESSNIYNYLIFREQPHEVALNFAQNVPTYWGDQPIVGAPAYVGVVLFFLCVLGLFSVKGIRKYVLLSGIILSLLLSYGKNLPILTTLMIDYFPLYSKFRAVSSIQVLLELCVPAFALLGLYYFIRHKNIGESKKWLLYALSAVSGLLVVLLLIKDNLSFTHYNDVQYAQAYGDDFVEAIRYDRKDIYLADIWRSLAFVWFVAAVLLAFVLGKIKENMVLIGVGFLLIFDLIGVANRYIGDDNYVSASYMKKPFELEEQEAEILKDTSYYRVFSTAEGLNGSKTSFFFHSLGGYHAAKPLHIQELFDYQLYAKNNTRILDMFNVKYLIVQRKEGVQVMENPDAKGNAWFVQNVINVPSADAVMQGLDTLNLSNALLQSKTLKSAHYEVDSLSSIVVSSYAPNKIEYKTQNAYKGFAVFSENYYANGWKATIDGVQTPIHKVNYALRAIEVPQGEHTVVFTFEPQVVKIGSTIALVSSVLTFIVLCAGGFWLIKQKANNL